MEELKARIEAIVALDAIVDRHAANRSNHGRARGQEISSSTLYKLMTIQKNMIRALVDELDAEYPPARRAKEKPAP